jgi:hypothetical protein
MISTWPLTRGFAWRLAAARLIVSVGAALPAWAAGAALGTVAPAGWPARAVPAVSILVLLVFRLPLKVGVLSYFYAHRAPLPTAP